MSESDLLAALKAIQALTHKTTADTGQLTALMLQIEDCAVAAIAKAERVDACALCGGVIGRDAWVDSRGELCGGPYGQSQCMDCETKNPPVRPLDAA